MSIGCLFATRRLLRSLTGTREEGESLCCIWPRFTMSSQLQRLSNFFAPEEGQILHLQKGYMCKKCGTAYCQPPSMTQFFNVLFNFTQVVCRSVVVLPQSFPPPESEQRLKKAWSISPNLSDGRMDPLCLLVCCKRKWQDVEPA